MNIKKDIILDFKNLNNNFYIICKENKLKFNIIDGTIDINIYNCNEKKISISSLNKNDNILIYYKNNIFKKIVVNTIYEFNSDSSDSETLNII
jgi:hypothetical protein